MKFRVKMKWALSILISGALFILVYAYFIEPNSIKTEFLDLSLTCANAVDNNLRFAQISDLHFTKNTGKNTISKIYNNINVQKPSAVFITGDLISDQNGIENTIKLVRLISSEYPTYVVFGNWDYWSLDFDMKDFTSKLENAGAKVMTNKNNKINLKGNVFYILGVKDPYTSGENTEDVDKALIGIDSGIKSCKILLAHSPNVIKYAKNKGIDLILVGHTHGGQVYVPFLSEELIPARREGGKGFISGLYSVDNDKMYVNRGIGTSGLPFRFLVPPELTIISIN